MTRATWVVTYVVALVACGGEAPPCDGDDDCASGETCDLARGRCAAAADGGGCTDEACDDGRYCNGVERCEAGACAAGSAPCAADQTCDEDLDACVADCDVDGDEHDSILCGGDDCDDDDGTRHPDSLEVCDADHVDEDCDTATFGERDGDGDGHVSDECCNVAAESARLCGEDCDDAGRDVNPDAQEICDAIDNDCDSAIDEDRLDTFYRDLDGDGYGRDDDTVTGCSAPEGYAVSPGDCDDTTRNRNPARGESCDTSFDDNCDGVDNEDCECVTDVDPPRACGPRRADDTLIEEGICRAGTQRCIGGVWESACADAVFPGAEACDPSSPGAGLDEDCDGATDEGTTVSGCFTDADSDGWGESPAGPRCAAAAGACPAGTVARGGDCDPRATVHPGATESCNGGDEDCDSRLDEGLHMFDAVFQRPSLALTSGCDGWEIDSRLDCWQAVSNACTSASSGAACRATVGLTAPRAAPAGSPPSSDLFTCVSGVSTTTAENWEFGILGLPQCDPLIRTRAGVDVCTSGAHFLCRNRGFETGFITGWGPLGAMFAPVYVNLACLNTAQARTYTTTFADLRALGASACDSSNLVARRGCAGGIRDFCRARGHRDGTGWTARSGETLTVACLNDF